MQVNTASVAPPEPREPTPLPVVRAEILKLNLNQREKQLSMLEQKAIRLLRTDKIDLPPVPRVANLLVGILNNTTQQTSMKSPELLERPSANTAVWSEPTLKDCANLISLDASLSATVLRYATSALHARTRIKSLDQAILRLGLRETAEIALSLSTRFLYDPQVIAAINDVGMEHEKLWERTAIVARSARDISKLLGFGDPDLVYTSALFHSSGHALALYLFAHLANQNVTVQKLSNLERAQCAAKIRSVVTATYLLSEGLPHDIVDTCLEIDSPPDIQISDSARVIRIALSLVHTLLKDGMEMPLNEERAFQAARNLGMTRKQLQAIHRIVLENQRHVVSVGRT
ncbi:MAG: HDOD domain-containing protein [Myxococcota bacterium]|nr:HDOD domain-containing protein [Myxococcota bacterium]